MSSVAPVKHAPLLIVDILAEGISVLRLGEGDPRADNLALGFGTPAPLPHNSRFIRGHSAEDVLEALRLEAHASDCAVEEHIIMLGLQHDPFDQSAGNFDTALRLLEALAAINACLLAIQTRSPLIVLALPILKSLGTKVCVTVCFETMNDSLSRHFMPLLSRPSERLKAARALSTFGVPVLIQGTPLPQERELERFAKNMLEVGLLCLAQDLHTLISTSRPLASRTKAEMLSAQLNKFAPEGAFLNTLEAYIALSGLQKPSRSAAA